MSRLAQALDAEPRRAGGRGKQSLRLWLGVLGCAILIERRLRARLRERFGVTLPQFDVLAELEHAGEPQTMSALSRRLMVSNGNVTGVVDRLAREGLVRRAPVPGDRRVTLIELTPKGRRAFARMAREHEQWITGWLADLSDADLDAAVRRLRQVRASVRRRAGGDG